MLKVVERPRALSDIALLTPTLIILLSFIGIFYTGVSNATSMTEDKESANREIVTAESAGAQVSQKQLELNRVIVDEAFVEWQAGRGSFYDLITDDGSVTIAGQSPHSGTFSKAGFLKDRGKPFQARFSTPIVPTNWKVWAVDDQVFVRWDSKATACDGMPYTNSYAYFITMKHGRATALTMFLDMGAFDDVWSRCQPAEQGSQKKR